MTDELGFHRSSLRAVVGQADMPEKAGEDYLTSGKLRQVLPELMFGGLRLSFCGICGIYCGIMRNLSEFRLNSEERQFSSDEVIDCLMKVDEMTVKLIDLM